MTNIYLDGIIRHKIQIANHSFFMRNEYENKRKLLQMGVI